MDNQTQTNIPSVQPPTQAPISPPTNGLRIFTFIIFGLVVVVGVIIIGIQIGKNQIPNQKPITVRPTNSSTQIVVNPTVFSTTTNITTTPSPDWKTYNNNQFGTYDYKVEYPLNWKVNNISQELSDVAQFSPLADGNQNNFVNIDCSTQADSKKELSNPYSWKGNEGGYYVKYFKKMEINGSNAIQYVWGAPDVNINTISGFLQTEILRNNPAVVCTITTSINNVSGKTVEEKVASATVYQQITASFKYGNNDNLGKKTNCVITGNRGQLCLSAIEKPPDTGELPMNIEYECLFKFAICEIQNNNHCGWTLTQKYKECINNPKN